MTQEQSSSVDFIRHVLIDALDAGYDDVITDLFDLYNKVRSRNNLASVGNIKISTTTDSITGGTLYDFYRTDNIPSSMSEDVISFG